MILEVKPSYFSYPGMSIQQSNYDMISIKRIIYRVSNYYSISEDDIKSKSRKREYVFPRQICHWITHKIKRYSYAYIAKEIGGKDHATVMHSIRTVNNLIETNKIIKQQLSEILKALNILHEVTINEIIIK